MDGVTKPAPEHTSTTYMYTEIDVCVFAHIMYVYMTKM